MLKLLWAISLLFYFTVLHATSAPAADICVSTSKFCSGSFGCCINIPERTCCTWPAAYGASVSFSRTMTEFSRGRGYSDLCATRTLDAGASTGYVCATAESIGRWAAANWVRDNTTFPLADSDASERACILPNVIGFATVDGKEHRVRVPDGKFDAVHALLMQKKFDDLLELEPVD